METKNRPSGQRASFIEEARRAQIVTAAREVVSRLGYGNASLARIAEQAGVSKSVISYHFDGKGDLLRQVVDEFFAEGWGVMEEAIEAETTYAGMVRAWITAEVAFFMSRRSEFLAVVEIMTGHRGPDGSRPFAASEAEEIDGLAELLAAGQSAGEFRPFDARQMATIIVRTTEAVLSHWLAENHDNLEVEAATLVDFVTKGIQA